MTAVAARVHADLQYLHALRALVAGDSTFMSRNRDGFLGATQSAYRGRLVQAALVALVDASGEAQESPQQAVGSGDTASKFAYMSAGGIPRQAALRVQAQQMNTAICRLGHTMPGHDSPIEPHPCA